MGGFLQNLCPPLPLPLFSPPLPQTSISPSELVVFNLAAHAPAPTSIVGWVGPCARIWANACATGAPQLTPSLTGGARTTSSTRNRAFSTIPMMTTSLASIGRINTSRTTPCSTEPSIARRPGASRTNSASGERSTSPQG